MIKPRGENIVPSGKVAGERFQGHRWASTRRSNSAPPSGCGNSLMPLAVAIKEVTGNNTIPTILLESSRALLLYLVAVRWNATIDVVGTHTTYYLPRY